MKGYLPLFLISCSVTLAPKPCLAQIVPDTTVGSQITPSIIQAVLVERINGGVIRGSNLFHSFQEFNIGTGNKAYFSNPDGVANIFTCVTGSNASNINGTLGVLGNANLFFLNPNGDVYRRYM